MPAVLADEDVVPGTLHEDGELEGVRGDDEVESHGSPRVSLQEDHEEAETNEDHHVHILEHRIVLCNRVETCSSTSRHIFSITGAGTIKNYAYDL